MVVFYPIINRGRGPIIRGKRWTTLWRCVAGGRGCELITGSVMRFGNRRKWESNKNDLKNDKMMRWELKKSFWIVVRPAFVYFWCLKFQQTLQGFYIGRLIALTYRHLALGMDHFKPGVSPSHHSKGCNWCEVMLIAREFLVRLDMILCDCSGGIFWGTLFVFLFRILWGYCLILPPKKGREF